jgi:hypothetical protein
VSREEENYDCEKTTFANGTTLIEFGFCVAINFELRLDFFFKYKKQNENHFLLFRRI